MPIYEYRCKQCNHTFEKLVASNLEADVATCPDCQGSDTRLLLSVFGIGSSDIASAPTTDMPICGTCGHSTPQPCSE